MDAMTDNATPVPTAGDKSARRRRPLRGGGGGWLRAAYWLLLTGGVVVMAVRSFRHSDALVVYTRSANAQGILSHRGRVLVAASDVSFGPERSLTADAASLRTDEGEALYTLVYKDWARRHERLGFGFMATDKGDLPFDGKPTVVAAVVPDWFVAGLTFLPVAWWARNAVRRRRRGRRGLCPHCGYPLAGLAGPCPECGRLRDGTTKEAAAAPNEPAGTVRPAAGS